MATSDDMELQTDTETSTGETVQQIEQLREVYRSQGPEAGESEAAALAALLHEQKNIDGWLAVQKLRCEQGAPQLTADHVAESLLDLLGATWEAKVLIEQAGFQSGLSAAGALQRMITLRALHPDTLVYDKTWGAGKVGRIDYFYKKIDIRFRKKPSHQMSLAYAAETLDLLDESHLLSWTFHRKEELKKMIAEQPGELVKMAIQSFGPLPVALLQEKLIPEVLSDKEWKKFWEGARKALKADDTVLIPANRKEPIQVMAGGKSTDDMHFAQLATERSIDAIINHFERMVDEKKANLNDAQNEIIRDRLAFVIKGAWPRQLGHLIRAKLAAMALGADDDRPELHVADRFLDDKLLLRALQQAPVRSASDFLEYLARDHAESLHQMLLKQLTRMDISSLNVAIDYLTPHLGEDAVAAKIREVFDRRKPGIEVLAWIARNMEKIEAWKLGHTHLVVQFMLDALDHEYTGDPLKARNQLRERFEKPEWMRALLDQFDYKQRVNLLNRLRLSAAWGKLDKQSVLAMVIKQAPELEAVMAERSATESADKPRGPLTSIRSYEERKEQLQRIIEVEIPKVAKEIGHAREYGDLRENFEFKAAKDAQALLFRRRDELSQALSTVTPTDFKDATYDEVSLGVTVVIRYEDGREETYHILGEWDGDPKLGILSCNARMSQTLVGHKVGETLVVPSEAGDVACTISAIQPLPDTIRKWILREI